MFLAAIFMVAGGAACGSAEESTTERVGPETSGDLGPVSLFNYYYVGGKSDAERFLQHERYVAECMASRGWEYHVPALESVDGGDEPIMMSDVIAFRRRYGYGLATIFSESTFNSSTDPNSSFYESLSPGARAQYDSDLGNLTGGCGSEADAKIASDLPFMNQSFQDVATTFVAALQTDQRYIDAVKLWSECLADRGYQVKVPDELRSQFVQRYDNLVSSSAISADPENPARKDFLKSEIAAATADIECDAEHLHPVQAEVESELIQQFVNEGKLPASWLDPPDTTS